MTCGGALHVAREQWRAGAAEAPLLVRSGLADLVGELSMGSAPSPEWWAAHTVRCPTELVASTSQTPDARERMAAFLEKRAPRFD